MNVLVTGGGTGGHVVPALAVADKLKQRGAKVLFVGSTKLADREAVERAGLEFTGIQAGKLRRYPSWRHLTDPFRVVAGYLQARRIIKRFKPDVVFAKGGYVSLPVVRAAAHLGRPVVIHDSDVVPGLANRLAAKVAARIAVSWPLDSITAASALPAAKLVYTGNPIRQGVTKGNAEQARRHFHLADGLPTILVLGGSQGSQAINRLIRKVLPVVLTEAQVIHQVGPQAATKVTAAIPGLAPKLRTRYHARGSLGDEQFDAYAVADLIISRAGANTLAEIAAVGKPSILIPLPSAASDHQRANAAVFAQAQATVVLEQTDAEADAAGLAQTIRRLLHDRQGRAKMGRAARQLAKLDAADELAELIWRQGSGHA